MSYGRTENKTVTALTAAQKAARGVFISAIALIVIVGIAVIIGFALFEIMGRNTEDYLGGFKPDTAALADGRYMGEYRTFTRTVARVEFVMEDGELKNLDFPVLFSTPGYNADIKVEDKIKARGDLRFDTVTGATRTSNFAKAAIKDAVEAGPYVEYESGLSGIDFR